MEKIRDLLIQANISESAADEIITAMDQYRAEVHEAAERDKNAKLERARQICEEETISHKRELERRVQIFLEAKSAEIDRILTKQAADRDTEATSKLTSIANIVEGVEPNGEAVSELKAKLDEARKQAKQLVEEKNAAVSKANHSVALAEKVLKHNRKLEKQLVEGTKTKSSTINEGVTRSAVPVKRLDTARTAATPVTTRRTLVENQVKNAPAANEFSQGSEFTPAEIARRMN